MFLIGGKGQPVRALDGVVHLITQHNTGGFSNRTACGIAWRRQYGVMFADNNEAVSCMTCLVHEARS
jgi:hypothetical protein